MLLRLSARCFQRLLAPGHSARNICLARAPLLADAAASNPGGRLHQTTNFDKRILVLTKRFKKISEVPDAVSNDMMEKARSKARIYMATLMMVATLVGCYVMVQSGKNAAKRGESITKQNLEWHRQYKESAQKEQK